MDIQYSDEPTSATSDEGGQQDRLIPAVLDDTMDDLGEEWPPSTPQKKKAKSMEKASFMMTSFNLANDILGPSVVTVPYFIAQLGFWASPVGFVLLGLVTGYTLSTLYSMGKKYRAHNFPDLCERAWGTKGSSIASVIIFVYNWGNLVAGLLIVGSSLPSLLRALFSSDSVWISRDYVLMWAALILLPFCFWRNISSYAINSTIAFGCLSGVIVLVMALSILGNFDAHQAPDLRKASVFGKQWLSAVAGIANMYVCHDLAVSVQSEMRDASVLKWRKVVGLVLSAILLLWWAIGWAGYLRFYDKCGANILDQFADDDVIAMTARALLCFSILVTVPYQCFMPRVSLESLVNTLYPRYHRMAFHALATTLVCVSAFFVCLFVSDLGFVYELIGSLSAIALAYIIPPLLVCNLEAGPWTRQLKLLNIGIAVLGVVFSVGGTYQIVASKFNFDFM